MVAGIIEGSRKEVSQEQLSAVASIYSNAQIACSVEMDTNGICAGSPASYNNTLSYGFAPQP